MGKRAFPHSGRQRERKLCPHCFLRSFPQPYPPSDLWIDSSTVRPSVGPSVLLPLPGPLNQCIHHHESRGCLGRKGRPREGLMTSPLTRATPCISLSSQPNMNFFQRHKKSFSQHIFFAEPRSNFRLVLRQTCCIHFPFRLQK